MVITEQMLSPYIGTSKLLESIDYLTEDESSYPAAKVPVRENERFGYTIALEDINEFCESNGINDMGYAVQQICDSSGINPSDVVFSVNEDSVIADQETSDFVLDIMQEGVPVVVAPISKNSIEYIMTDEAVDYYMQTGDGYLLEALANDDIEAFLEDRKPRKIGKSNAQRVSRTNSKSQQSVTTTTAANSSDDGNKSRFNLADTPQLNFGNGVGINPQKRAEQWKQDASTRGPVSNANKQGPKPQQTSTSAGNKQEPKNDGRFNLANTPQINFGNGVGINPQKQAEQWKQDASTRGPVSNANKQESKPKQSSNGGFTVSDEPKTNGTPSQKTQETPKQSNSQQQTTSTPPPAQQQSQPKNTAPAGDPPKAENSEETGIFNAAKNAVRKGREHVAKLIASLNTKLKEWEDKGQAQDAGRFAKLRGYVSKIISYLTQKLHSFVQPSNK
jgi:hypothetical protein